MVLLSTLSATGVTTKANKTMPKQYFWPATLILFGAIFAGTAIGMMPVKLLVIWPIFMLIIGLGGLATADRSEWLQPPKRIFKKKKK